MVGAQWLAILSGIFRFFPGGGAEIPVGASPVSALAEQDLRDVVLEVERVYAPVFRQDGARLTIQADWRDARVNSYATRDESGEPLVVAPGGIARHPAMTMDGLRAVLCHEIGHFLGGAPKIIRGGDPTKLSWSSAEGQADYFAATRCLKRLFAHEGFGAEARVALAGAAVARFFAAVSGSAAPDSRTPDTATPSRTLYGHPSAQCRLDTFIAGSRCAVDPESRLDDRDPSTGACTGDGSRPRCWFSQG